MGKKKKFIDKKKSATFQLMARDTADPDYSSGLSGDRVFVRIDNNQYTPDSFNEPYEGNLTADPDSIYADAPEDYDDEYATDGVERVYNQNAQTTALPDHIRKEILELGFPDDGYNYLSHLREIKNTGGGSAYYQNPKANFDRLPQDIKAYDASGVKVSKIDDTSEEKSIYNVASKTVDVRLQRVLDPEVAALLDDSDLSKFGSDVEDLEEDFVVRANLFDRSVGEEINGKLSSDVGFGVDDLQSLDLGVSGALENGTYITSLDTKMHRVRRPLDEQFDLLELNEYGADSEEEYDGYINEDECQESLTEKLNRAFKNHPSGLLHHNMEGDDNESPELTAEVIRRCREYAEKYEDEEHDEEEVLVEESSDESEVWDCETVISTYSTLDNHPGKIGVPEAQKKKLAEAASMASTGPKPVITLKGKERLPADYLPYNKKQGKEKMKDDKGVSDQGTGLLKKKPRSQESKEEKKERKSAVKSERREARQVKKEMKGLYKSEAHRAQKVAAFTGPSSMRIM